MELAGRVGVVYVVGLVERLKKRKGKKSLQKRNCTEIKMIATKNVINP